MRGEKGKGQEHEGRRKEIGGRGRIGRETRGREQELGGEGGSGREGDKSTGGRRERTYNRKEERGRG